MLDGAELHRLAEQDAILLAPNLRAAKQVRNRLVTHADGANTAATLGEHVLHWRAWTSALWRGTVLEGRDERVLLHPLQERLLWEQILDSDEGVERSDALLDLCLSAVTLLYQHNAADALLAERETGAASDVASFTRWFRAFDDHCSRERLLPWKPP